MSKRYNVSLNEQDQERMNQLIQDGGYYGPSDVLRNGIKALYDDVWTPSKREGVLRRSKDKAPKSTVDKLREKKQEEKEKKQAQIELLKEEKADLLDGIENYEISEDSDGNAWVHWQYFQKRGAELQSWKGDYQLKALHNELATLPQYQPSKESIIKLLENGGNVIVHSKHDEYDTMPDDIKPYLKN